MLRLMTPCGAAAAVAVLLGLSLVGCTATRDTPTVGASAAAVASPSAPAPAATRPATATAPPAQVLARFDAVNRRTVRRLSGPGGRAFVDALVAAGFEKTDMQVTEDRTTIGAAAPSVQFSLLWRGTCLLGQYGQQGGYRTTTGEPVNGRCLIGRTRSIDW